MNNNQNNGSMYTEENEMSLKDIIIMFQDFFWEIWRNWKIIPLIVLPIAGYMLYRSLTAPVTYTADLTCMVNDDEEQGQQMAALIGLIGGQAGEYNLDKILELSKSRRIVQKTLFQKAVIDSTEDYFANHIIRIYDFNNTTWEDIDHEFYFKHDSVPGFKKMERYALKCVFEKVVGFPKWGTDGMLTGSINESTGIMTLSMTTKTEELAIEFVKAAYENLSEYYVEKTISKQSQTFNMLENKSDSIHSELLSSELELKRFQESHRQMWSKVERVKEVRLTREVNMNTILYAKAIENLSVAEFALLSKTPFVILIDDPVYPIYPSKDSVSTALFLAVFLGIFLAVAFIVARKLYRDTMNKPSKQEENVQKQEVGV